MKPARRSLVILVTVLAACSTGSGTVGPQEGTVADRPNAIRIVLVGDIMLGRNVAPVVRDDPESVFAGSRSVIKTADLAMFNLESPLTTRPHRSTNPNDLSADPAAAGLLADAGFDVANLANNHTGDQGTAGVGDTVNALLHAGITPAGVTDDDAEDGAIVVDAGGVSVGIVAFTLVGSDAAPASVAVWDQTAAKGIVARLRSDTDLLIVSLHGGSELIPVADESVTAIADRLVGWGVDVVWGHGPHVAHPIEVSTAEGGGRRAVVATSLGNFLFDQHVPGADVGAVLEVWASRDGVAAFRVGDGEHGDLRAAGPEWRPPANDAVLLDGAWWTPVDPPEPEPVRPVAPDSFPHGEVTMAALGDVNADGVDELVVAYRHPFRETPLNRLDPDRVWQDAQGRSAHIGIFTTDGSPIWAAGTLADPIDVIAPCDGAVGVVYHTFDGTTIATGALRWLGFGLSDAPLLPGNGTPGCADIDGDGVREVVIIAREEPAIDL